MSKAGNAQNKAKCKAYRDRGQREKNKERRAILLERDLGRAFAARVIRVKGVPFRELSRQDRRSLVRHA